MGTRPGLGEGLMRAKEKSKGSEGALETAQAKPCREDLLQEETRTSW